MWSDSIAAQKGPLAENGQDVHLSLAFLDSIGGKHVCLVPDEKPADIYKVVAEKAIAKMEAAVSATKEDSPEMSQEDEVTEAQLAQWWLDYGINRKVTKRNTMTFAYGSKQRGMSDQILEVEEFRNNAVFPQMWSEMKQARK